MQDKTNHKPIGFIGTQHNTEIPLFDTENDRELSNFFEFVGNLEGEILTEFFELQNDFDTDNIWGTAIFITDNNSKIVYQTKSE